MHDLISVIIPVYNIPTDYLKSCLDSVLGQSYKNIEVIIVNDSSPNLENEVTIREYTEKDKRIVYIQLAKNQGVSFARNLGLEKFSGDWITFVDADDVLPTDSLEKMLDAANREDASLVMSAAKFDQNVGGGEFIIQKRDRKIRTITENESSIREAIADFKMSFWGKLYKREILTDIRFPLGVAHFEDFTLLWKIATMPIRYVIISKVGYIARYREGSASRSYVDYKKCEKLLTALCYCVQEINCLFGNQNDIKKMLSAFVLRESFAYRSMFASLSRTEQKTISPFVKNLHHKLKEAKLISPAMHLLIKMRIICLTHGLGLDKILFYLTRIQYRLENR